MDPRVTEKMLRFRKENPELHLKCKEKIRAIMLSTDGTKAFVDASIVEMQKMQEAGASPEAIAYFWWYAFHPRKTADLVFALTKNKVWANTLNIVVGKVIY